MGKKSPKNNFFQAFGRSGIVNSAKKKMLKITLDKHTDPTGQSRQGKRPLSRPVHLRQMNF